MSLLDVRKLSKTFGGLVAVNALDFSLEQGMIASVIGPNGAGKTTVFNIITGLYAPSQGEIVFDGRAITGWRPNRITARGIGRTFQTIRLFNNMTSAENILAGMHCRLRGSWLGAILHSSWVRREEASARRRAAELLGYMGLRDRDEFLPNTSPTLISGVLRSLERCRRRRSSCYSMSRLPE
jgi:ABC-type branched-subunit amino acid transport system ATPase component